MKNNIRSEAEVFGDLEALTSLPGYIHAVAHVCMRDTMVAYREKMKATDLEKMFGQDRLIRTEIVSLLGLMAHGPLDVTLPASDVVRAYVERTDRLMKELQGALRRPAMEALLHAMRNGQKDADMWRGEAFREPIFYGGESAYSFQYRDLVADKYGADDPWLIQNKGFSISQAQAVARAMCALMEEKAAMVATAAKVRGATPDTWLPAYEQSPEEISNRSGVPMPQVQACLDAFTLSGRNEAFRSLVDFNAVAATPLFRTDRGTVLLFQQYSIYEALYESPYYWMMADKAYEATASTHRGEFTERYSAKRLACVFGAQHVHSNVNLVQGKAKTAGEIDVLVVFGDRLIIVQAKAKKLTLEARRGNDGQLRKDFAAAIQDSYDQGWLCANAIVAGHCQLVDSQGREITLPHVPKEIYIFNVVSEHYPALAFQARQFLKYQTTDRIRPPFVMDVFLLDVLTEMLSTPMRLLSYVRMRVDVIKRVTMSHERTALAFHLRRNMWLEPDDDSVMLDDTVSIDLDTAMIVRREHIPGERTPPGILTRLAGTLYEHLVAQIEQCQDPATLELGFHLLALNEDTCRHVHHGLEAITRRALADGRRHDFTIGHTGGGICFHCNPSPSEGAKQMLRSHCEMHKYKKQACRWFGVSVDSNADLQFGLALDYKWEQSEVMDEVTRGMNEGRPPASLSQFADTARKSKVGRNDPCPCGSGKKYKRCCLP